MRLMKSTVLAAAVLVLILAVVVGAQTNQPGQTNQGQPQTQTQNKMRPSEMSDTLMIERHVTMLRDSLNLTDTQEQQIRTILMNEQQQMMADRQQYAGKPKTLSKARTDLRKSTDKQIKSVLNKDQVKKYDQIEKQYQQKHPMRQSKKTDHSTSQKSY